MTQGQEIFAVGGDIGGARELLLVTQEIWRRGLEVRWFLDPSGRAMPDLFENQKSLTELGIQGSVQYETRCPEDSDRPCRILVGTSATAVERQLEWTRFGREQSIPVDWVEDWYATGSRKNTQTVSPDRMFVSDSIAKTIAEAVRPDLEVLVHGSPFAGSILARLIRESLEFRPVIRHELGLTDADFLVTWIFGGDPPHRAWRQLVDFSSSLEELQDMAEEFTGLNVIVNFRFHPKHPDGRKLQDHARSVPVRQTDSADCGIDLQRLVLSSNMVFADWGNTDTRTTLLGGIPIATLLFPNDLQHRVDAGFPSGVPPVLMSHEGWGVKSVREMLERIRFVREDEARARRITEERALPFQKLIEPGAAERIADAIIKSIEAA